MSVQESSIFGSGTGTHITSMGKVIVSNLTCRRGHSLLLLLLLWCCCFFFFSCCWNRKFLQSYFCSLFLIRRNYITVGLHTTRFSFSFTVHYVFLFSIFFCHFSRCCCCFHLLTRSFELSTDCRISIAMVHSYCYAKLYSKLFHSTPRLLTHLLVS